jgi:membrane fusion protein (multidrug efflux system)
MGKFEPRIRYRLLLAAASATILTLAGCSDQQAAAPQAMQMPPPAVDVVTLKSETLELKDTLAGRVSAFRTAEIRPQVNGIILKRFFDEGATVKAGDKLYQIDPSLYQAALASAEAQLTVAEANAYAARLKAKRYKELSKKSAISAQEVDDSEAAAKQADAQVKAAQAEVRSAKVNLGYTEITAPISGVIGRSTITEGALVSAQQATALTTIRQLTPIYVDIQRPAASLMRMKNPSLSRSVTVELDDGTPYADVGELQFADVSVDQGTGTVNVRAQFENKDALLLPGMFVRANVPSALIENAILVPQQAIVRQANATTTAYVLDDANVVSLRGVEVTRAIGDKWLVKVGLNAGDRVIISGLQKVKPGITVAPEEAKP